MDSVQKSFVCMALLLAANVSRAAPATVHDATAAFEAYANPALPVANGFEQLRSRGKAIALAHARVRTVTSTEVVLETMTYENHLRHFIILEISGWTKHALKVGDIVKRGQKVGRALGARVAIYRRQAGPLETYFKSEKDFIKVEKPREFLARRRTLFTPHLEPQLILVDNEHHSLQIRERGKVVANMFVAFGQEDGRKRVQGDKKTPRGMYFVTTKTRAEFGGTYGAYYGGHWIKLNYPNAFDADYGLANKLISPAVQRRIKAKWRKRKLPPQGTRLGGGIGFHGWAGTRTSRDDWSDDDTRLSFGCIVLHNVDIGEHFDRIRKRTMVVLLSSRLD